MPDSKSFYCFYTPERLARRLIDLIPENDIHSVIDINCGKGDLLKAANQRYPDAELIGIDIQEDEFYNQLSHCSFHKEDGFTFAKKCNRKFDLILSNPPFGRCEEIISKAIDKKELVRNRWECVMLDANISLMHKNSWMILILPITVITGQSYNSVRKMIGKELYVWGLISLPLDTFGTRLINTYAIILYGKPCDGNTKVYYATKQDNKWRIQRKGTIPYTSIIEGKWIEYKEHIFNSTIDIFRGLISSSDFTKEGKPVYHNSQKKDDIWKPSIRYIREETGIKRKACNGDIIINRVGHSVGYWWENDDGEYPISDCVFVLRGIEGIKDILQAMSIEGRLDVPIRGVATQYITQQDIIDRIIYTMKERNCNLSEVLKIEDC